MKFHGKQRSLSNLWAAVFIGVERANIQFGDTVVLTGCGPIGLLMLQAAQT